MSNPNPKSIFSSFSQNINKLFNFSHLNCATSDTTIPNSNKENPLLKDPTLCPSHLRERSHYCTPCQKTLCFICASDHLSLKHQVLEYKEIGPFIGHQIKDIITGLEEAKGLMLESPFPDYKTEIENGLKQIKEARDDLFTLIGLYFENLDYKYRELFKRVPSVYQVQEIKGFLEVIKKEVIGFEAMEISTKKPDIDGLQRFLDCNFNEKIQAIYNQYDALLHVKDSSKRVNLPTIQTNKSLLEQIFSVIPNYCIAVPSTESSYDQLKKIRVSTPNYFLPEFDSYLPYIDDLTEKLHLYNISKEVSEGFNLNVGCEIPEEHSIVISPNLEVYITGGILKNSELTDRTFHCSPFNSSDESFHTGVPLKEKTHMGMKRVAHGLCIVKNKIYCIGGKISGVERTKRCERYDVGSDKWVEIAGMHAERSRPAMSSFDDR